MVQLKPSDIGYSQDSISCVFTGSHWGKKIGETLDELVDGDISVADIPTISVIFKNGIWFTCDNRRLWVLKHFELLGGCTEIYVNETNYMDWRKFTTYNGGTSVRVRGDPGGTWYYKYSRNAGKFKNYLLNRNINPFNKSYGSNGARSFISDVLTSKPQRSFPLQVQNDWRSDNQGTNTRQLQNTLNATYGFHQQPLNVYHINEHTDRMFSSRTFLTGKTIVDNSSLSHDHVLLDSDLSTTKQASILTSSGTSITSAVPNEINKSFPTNRNDEPLTSLTNLSKINHDEDTEKNTDASLSSPTCTVESVVPETKTKTTVDTTKHTKSCCIIL